MNIDILEAYIGAIKQTADIVEIMGVKMLIIPESAIDNAIQALKDRATPTTNNKAEEK